MVYGGRVIRIKHKVREFRTTMNMSKAALARRIGAVRSYITKVENEELQPSGPVMLRFAHVLQRSVEELFQLTELPSGQAAFQPISQRASVRAGESNKPAEVNKHKKR
jgi:DNA-binding XRE family transcriptional regulator